MFSSSPGGGRSTRTALPYAAGERDSHRTAVHLHLLRVHIRPGGGRSGRRHPSGHTVRGDPGRLVLPGLRGTQEGLRALRGLSRPLVPAAFLPGRPEGPLLEMAAPSRLIKADDPHVAVLAAGGSVPDLD